MSTEPNTNASIYYYPHPHIWHSVPLQIRRMWFKFIPLFICYTQSSVIYAVELWDSYNDILIHREGNGNPLQYSCLENPMDGGAWGLQSMGSLRVRHDWATSLSLFTFMHWRRKWRSTPVFSPGESQGLGSLVGCCLWGRIESDTTEAT